MASFNGHWKAEWQSRVGYFNKQVGKAEKTVDKKDKTPAKQKKKWGFWAKVEKQKKPKETELEKHFALLDMLYEKASQGALDGAKRQKLMSEFHKVLKVTAKKANTYAVKEFLAFTNAAIASDMPDDLKAAKKKEIKNLGLILQADVDAMITNAHTWYTSKMMTLDKDGNTDMAGVLRSTYDPKMLQQKSVTLIKKAVSWIKKAERNPDLDDYNTQTKDLSREIMAQFSQLIIVAQKCSPRSDFKLAKRLQGYLGPMGGGDRRLPKTASEAEVAAKIQEYKKVVAATTKWVTSCKV